MGKADRASVHVGRVAERDCTGAEHLRLRGELDVDLEADDRFPAAHDGASSLAARNVGAVSNPIAPSSAYAARRMRFSENAGPMNWKPTGKPSARPQGIEIAGRPARLTGIVQMSLMYIANGSA